MSTTIQPKRITISIDGKRREVLEGQFLGAVLHTETAGFRRTTADGTMRGLFCGMGICFDCLVAIDGKSGIRACVTPVREGMRVETDVSAGARA